MIEEAQQATRKTISKRLRERKKVSGMDVPALAKASGVSKAMIYAILNCSKSASSDTLSALASALEIPMSVLVP
jgi:transcriptional regulator with XRE-family HTH domain